MHAAIAMVQKILRPVSAQLDLRNARNLVLAVAALGAGRRLTLMDLARHWPQAERVSAPLKRLDRLLGNVDVHALRSRFYESAARWLVRSEQPVLIVDWSELKADARWHLLRAGVVAHGRTITLYEEVHPESKKNNRKVEAAFLRELKRLLPAAVRPIVVTDAGFRNPWFKAVEAIGWHWIGRVGARRLLRCRGESLWIRCETLHALATGRACSLGKGQLSESNRIDCRFVLVRRRKRGRIELNRFGKRARSHRSRKMAARAKEPWLLAASCSLNALSAAAIVGLYAKRMQIEQSFRDLKSHRYGCAFEDSLTRSAPRLEMLLLIHMLASLAAWLAALAAPASAWAHVCLGSLSKRYSLLTIGWACLRLGKALPSASPPSYAAPPTRLLLSPLD